MTKFDRDQFAADCLQANTETDPVGAIREILASALSDPADVLRGIGEPTEAGMDVLLRSDELTIFAATWTPRMCLLPHNHDMWAMIGIYTGREDNIFWHETDDGLKSLGANCLFEGDIATLGKNAVHSVTNPLLRFTGGIHIYGGEFFDTPRHQWDPETLEKEPTNGDMVRALFARENERYAELKANL
ncbi:MAG: hypothetical protein CMK07_09625 [Ponticaulis sp.]|nr:hypothetical protein [Ponticaulis sp.]